MVFLLKKILSGFILVIGLLILTFFMLRLSPGNPAADMFDTTHVQNAMMQKTTRLGLDRPIWLQFEGWIKEFVKGNWGNSFAKNQPVKKMIFNALPNTLLLTVSALLFQAVAGTLMGLLQVRFRNSLLDRTLDKIALLFYALPGFWVALVLILIFANFLHLLPVSQMVSYYYDGLSIAGKIQDRIFHLILPVIAMGLVALAGTARYVKNCTLDILSHDFILAAKARGLSKTRILFKHALRNILSPVVTLIGQNFPALVGGSVVIELIFSWPGMGRLIVMSSYARDYPVILACTFVISLFVILGNILTELINAVLDPRIRLQ